MRPPTEPLWVKRFAARGFRNLADLELEPGARFNVVHGDNGQGKTNLLEALDYLSTLRSFRGAAPAELILHGAEAAVLAARIETGPTTREERVRLAHGSPREVLIDGRRVRARSGPQGLLPAVLFHPGDVGLVSGSPERRRALLDRALAQLDATFSSTAAAYDRALRSRNRLLRPERVDARAVHAYDEILAAAGAVIGRARAALVDDLAPRVSAIYGEITGEDDALRLRYAPRVEPEVERLRKALADALDRDQARGFTADGPHADDLEIALEGRGARRFASQGQQRAAALALKVAELGALEARSGRVPLLLLDDVSSELDASRSRRLFACLARLGGQVFLTTTHPGLIPLDRDRTDFRMARGVVERD